MCVWPASGSLGSMPARSAPVDGIHRPRGGVPLSVTVTAKLSGPLKPGAGVYVATPLAVTLAVPCAGGVLTLKVCVWLVSGSLGLTGWCQAYSAGC